MNGVEASFATSLLRSGPVFVERSPQIRVAPTGATETPLPSDIAPPVLMDLGTQTRAWPTDAGSLAVEARRYMGALAAIPVDSRIDEAVEALAKQHDRATGKRPLTRK